MKIIAPNKWVERQVKSASISFDTLTRLYIPLNSQVFSGDREVEGHSDKPFRILFSASDLSDTRKGAEHFINSLRVLAKLLEDNGKKREDIEIVLPSNGGSRLVSLIPFPTRVIPFATNDRELNRIYREVNVYVCCSIEDSGPLMIGESMMSSTPVISFDMGVARELIGKSGVGSVVPVGDEEAIARSIFEHYLLPIEERRNLGKRAREFVMGILSERAFAAKLNDIINSGNSS